MFRFQDCTCGFLKPGFTLTGPTLLLALIVGDKVIGGKLGAAAQRAGLPDAGGICEKRGGGAVQPQPPEATLGLG